jgi:hypothetical protein
VVEHETSRAFVSKKFPLTAGAPSWNLVLLLVAPHELEALNALSQTTLDQLNMALESESAKPANRRDVLSAYQFARRTG